MTPRRNDASSVALFLLPALLLVGMFLVWPIVEAGGLSLYDWNGVSADRRFVALRSWATLVHDSVFWRALLNNFAIVALSLAVELPVAMALAVLLERGGRRLRLLKLAYVLPMLMSTVSVGILFKYVYDPELGLLNGILRSVGAGRFAASWLGEPGTALGAVVAVVCWQSIPFYMLLFVAALAGIPREVREAALVDGASEWQYFRRVALPLVRGTVRTAVVLAFIGSLKYFDLVWVMTEGGPSHASELLATYMYKRAFTAFDVGYGSTIATALFVLVMLVGLASVLLGRRAGSQERTA